MGKKIKLISQIGELRKRYYQALSGKESLVKILAEAEVSEHVYNSNAIENSTLTLEETEKILLQIDLDRYVSEREIFEAKNLARVTEYIDMRAKEQEVSLALMLLLHKMLITNIRNDIAGRFRKDDEWVRVGSHVGADPKHVEEKLIALLVYFQSSAEKKIIERLAKFHLVFESIHPFCDGNGRIGRTLNNYILIREGYVPINIAFINRQRYYEAFREFEQNGSTKIMEEIIGRALTMSYHKRLAYLEGKNIITVKQYALENKLKYNSVLNKALRQTIPAFRERGKWKIGV